MNREIVKRPLDHLLFPNNVKIDYLLGQSVLGTKPKITKGGISRISYYYPCFILPSQ